MSQSSSGTKPPCVALGFGAAVGVAFGTTTVGATVGAVVGAAVGWGIGVAIANVVGTEVGADATAGGADALATGLELAAAGATTSAEGVGMEVAVAVGGEIAFTAASVVALGQIAWAASGGAYVRPSHHPSTNVITIAPAM